MASLCWSALTVAFAIAMSLRYYHRLVSVASRAVVWTLLAAFYLVLALPLAVSLLAPLCRRPGPALEDHLACPRDTAPPRPLTACIGKNAASALPTLGH